MNTFAGLAGEKRFYKAMLLTNALNIRIDEQGYSVAFYIVKYNPENYSKSEKIKYITFTELRKYSKEHKYFFSLSPKQTSVDSVYYPILNTINYYSVDGKVKINKMLFLKNPMVLRAQNLFNLMGYGDEWRGGVLISEGTKYGETTNYYMTHIIVTPRERV